MSEQINSALARAKKKVTACSDTPGLDAEVLLAHCLGKSRSYLYSWPEHILPEAKLRQFMALVDERIKPTPIAYLLGHREFFSLEFKTTTAALIPRPETELLVETVFDHLPAGRQIKLLELGTGTGAIAITLKKHRPDIELSATDISPACLTLARENAAIHEVDIEWIQSDWFSAVDSQRCFDVIVSNPPYIAAHDPYLREGDLPAEPILALSPGVSGLESLEQIISEAPAYLNTGGLLLLEHGYDQAGAVKQIMKSQGFIGLECKRDINDLDRVSLGRSD